MRELMITRIKELKDDTRYNAWRLFHRGGEYYKNNLEDLDNLTDKDLCDVFETVVRWAYKCY